MLAGSTIFFLLITINGEVKLVPVVAIEAFQGESLGFVAQSQALQVHGVAIPELAGQNGVIGTRMAGHGARHGQTPGPDPGQAGPHHQIKGRRRHGGNMDLDLLCFVLFFQTFYPNQE